jgi:hypothetical protein
MDEQIYKDPRTYSTSYSSKGYGVGFVSKVPRFSSEKNIIYPGPGDYSPDTIFTLENKTNKSNFGKSIFLDKTSKSLHLLDTTDNKFYTSQELLSKITKKANNNRYKNNLINNSLTTTNDNDDIIKEEIKGNYFFESKVKKFNRGIFDVSNKNPVEDTLYYITLYSIICSI